MTLSSVGLKAFERTSPLYFFCCESKNKTFNKHSLNAVYGPELGLGLAVGGGDLRFKYQSGNT